MKMFVAFALVSALAVAHGSILPLGLGGLDSYAVPNYAYNYAIKDITGGAQEKSETRLGDVTKEQDSVVVNHWGGKLGLGSGVSQQNTQIIRGPGIKTAVAAAPLGIAAAPLGIAAGPLGIAAGSLGIAGSPYGIGAGAWGLARPLAPLGLGLGAPLGLAPGLGLAGQLGYGGLGLKGLW